jgi:hypothetical protein
MAIHARIFTALLLEQMELLITSIVPGHTYKSNDEERSESEVKFCVA